MSEDIYLITSAGTRLLESRLQMQLQLQSDPVAVATINAAHLEKMKKGEELAAKLSAGQGITEDEFTDVYGDIARLVNGTLGIINIKGPIETSEKSWHTYFGVPSYERIVKVLDTMAQMGNVKEVLWVWNSPGGNAKGCFDCGKHIAQVQKNGIAMSSYVETAMMSAATVLGTVPKKVYSASDADVGSVGAMSTLMNYRKAYEKAGVEPIVFKYGALKDIGSPYREMTKGEAKFFQDRVNNLGVQIVSTVQANRKMSAEQFLEAAGDAKIVTGTEASLSGLVDGVKTFDEVVNAIIAGHNAPQAKPAFNTGASTMTKKYRLNAQGLAAVAAGLAPEEAMKNAALVEEDTTPDSQQPVLTGAADDADADADTAPQPGVEVAPVVQAAAPAPQAGQTDLTGLIGQLTDEKAKSISLQTQLNAANEELAALKSEQVGLLDIAAKAVLNLEVACGNTTATSESLKALGSAGLIARHGEMLTAFKSKMRTGQVTTAVVQPRTEARAASVTRSRMDAVLGGKSE